MIEEIKKELNNIVKLVAKNAILFNRVKKAIEFENDDIEYLGELFKDAINGTRIWLDRREEKRGKELILQLYKSTSEIMQNLEQKYNLGSDK